MRNGLTYNGKVSIHDFFDCLDELFIKDWVCLETLDLSLGE